MRVVLRACAVVLALAGSAAAQNEQTLADIRQEMSVLYVEIQNLRRELSTTGSPQVNTGAGPLLDRVNTIESELQRLTALTEQLQFRVDQIVRDGTNRLGDLEFRLVELEGGDVSQLGETSTLGGGQAPAVAPAPVAPAAQPETQLAAQEQADYDRAAEAFANGDLATAVDGFARFNQTYPGGPLAARADLTRGQALEGLGDTREAARAYLSAYTIDQSGPDAAEALYRLGAALGGLGQLTEACVTLGEVALRFPNSAFIADAEAERSALACS